MKVDDTCIYPTHRCFDNALDFIVEVLKANPEDAEVLRTTLILVHGICLTPDGHPYAHAWVEHDGRCIFRGHRGSPDAAPDYFGALQTEYYAEIQVQEVTRYSVEEAIRENHRTGNYGPWIPAYRALCGDKLPQAHDEITDERKGP